ncbi:helix-turn-helix domain-containing protein [Alkalihalophilus sp. As8PL]|uniref:Helix-turn-helix domain-containing protein n=1 Tax=Alkalihalophilus sp. As8PL TaxID=3237103 RepID=A0AB39BYH7_9BACI
MNKTKLFSSTFITASSHKLEEGGDIDIKLGSDQSLLIYVVTGQIKYEENSRNQTIQEGEARWLKTHLFNAYAVTRSIVYSAVGSREGLSEDEKFPELATNKRTAKLVPLWAPLLERDCHRTFSHYCQKQSAWWNLLAQLTEENQIIKEEMVEIASQLSEQLVDAPTVADLAEKARMTPASFSRAFRKRTGYSPKEFLNNERINKAKQLMIQQQTVTLREIALQVGLQDEFYFSKLFKKRTGVSPTTFLKRIKKRVAVVSQLFLQDHLLALGVQPILSMGYPSLFHSSGLPSYYKNEMVGSLIINAEDGCSPKEVVSLSPDLIIKTPLRDEEKLSVLWTHHTNVHTLSFQTQWENYLIEIANIIDRSEYVDEIIREVRSLERWANNQLQSITTHGHWAVIWIRKEEIRLYGKGGHANSDLLFKRLGFKAHPQLPESGYEIISIERLLEINPEKLLILWSDEADVTSATELRAWSEMKAVKKGNVYYPNSLEWDPWGPIGRKHMINELVQYFLQFPYKE